MIVSQSLFWADFGLPSVCVFVCVHLHLLVVRLVLSTKVSKDLGHFWLGFIRMLRPFQMSAHLLNFDSGTPHYSCTLIHVRLFMYANSCTLIHATNVIWLFAPCSQKVSHILTCDKCCWDQISFSFNHQSVRSFCFTRRSIILWFSGKTIHPSALANTGVAVWLPQPA